jgi:SAM-dependent methyltransferase
MEPLSSLNQPAGGYDPGHFADLVEVEDRHFWFRSRNEVILKLVSQLLRRLPVHARMLEVGCGDGNALRFLERAAAGRLLVGTDFFAEGLAFASQRTTCPLVRADLRSLPFQQPFHLVGMFDVLEHIPDDVGALRQLRDALTPEGILLLTVPAGPALWSSFDEASGHCRRYTAQTLRRAAESAGYQVERLSPFMAGIYAFVWLTRRLVPSHSVAEELKIVPVLNELFYRMLAVEGRWLTSGRALPFGTSLIAVLRKQS